MKISGEIKSALSQLIDQHGNATQLAKALDVAHTTVLAWINGRADEISGDVWYEKLEPKLRPFLPSSKSFAATSALNDAPPPASNLAFVQRMKRQRDLRPIELAILEKLRGMTERQLARVYADLVYSPVEDNALLSAEKGVAYRTIPRQWLLVFPQMDDSSRLGLAFSALESVTKFRILMQGPFTWGLVNWSQVPPSESSAFDDFLMFHFAQPVPYVVEQVHPTTKPYGFVIEVDADSANVVELVKAALPNERFHPSPYHETAYGKCLSPRKL